MVDGDWWRKLGGWPWSTPEPWLCRPSATPRSLRVGLVSTTGEPRPMSFFSQPGKYSCQCCWNPTLQRNAGKCLQNPWLKSTRVMSIMLEHWSKWTMFCYCLSFRLPCLVREFFHSEERRKNTAEQGSTTFNDCASRGAPSADHYKLPTPNSIFFSAWMITARIWVPWLHANLGVTQTSSSYSKEYNQVINWDDGTSHESTTNQHEPFLCLYLSLRILVDPLITTMHPWLITIASWLIHHDQSTYTNRYISFLIIIWLYNPFLIITNPSNQSESLTNHDIHPTLNPSFFPIFSNRNHYKHWVINPSFIHHSSIWSI